MAHVDLFYSSLFIGKNRHVITTTPVICAVGVGQQWSCFYWINAMDFFTFRASTIRMGRDDLNTINRIILLQGFQCGFTNSLVLSKPFGVRPSQGEFFWYWFASHACFYTSHRKSTFVTLSLLRLPHKEKRTRQAIFFGVGSFSGARNTLKFGIRSRQSSGIFVSAFRYLCYGAVCLSGVRRIEYPSGK